MTRSVTRHSRKSTRSLTRSTPLRLGTVAAGLAASTAAMLALTGAGSATTSHASLTAGPVVNCAANLAACGYPTAASTGVPASTTLKTVGTQVTSGPGWTWNAAASELDVTGSNVTLSGLSVTGDVNITGNNVTLSNDQILSNGGYWAVKLEGVSGTTITNSTLGGTNTGSGRVGSAICDITGTSTGTTISNDNISYFKTAIQVSAGTISGNYIHDPGYVAGDHTNGILDVGTTQALSITGNTILINLGQTDAVSLDSTLSNQAVGNKTVSGNYLAGGSYDIYAGGARGDTTSNIRITNNRFGQAYYSTSGQYGPVAYFTATDPGNTWTGNVWDSTGAAVPSS
jgi:hypothetical protein